MNRILTALLLLSACAPGGRDQSFLSSPSFRARSVTIAASKGARGKGVEISRELLRRLASAGLSASSLEESDSVLAGSALEIESARSPRLLAEIRRATGADAIVFLSLDPAWRALEISVLDARTGDAVLRSAAHPRDEAFVDAPEIAEAAARILAALGAERRVPRASRADAPMDEIPLP